MSDVKLLPCPFCGGEAEIQRYGDSRRSTQYACTFCGCFLETGEEFNHGARWNTRAPDRYVEGMRAGIEAAAHLVEAQFTGIFMHHDSPSAAYTQAELVAAIRAIATPAEGGGE